ncbi:MAG: winged helix-turn-helix transcriptional regulator [Bacteroidales bacterium]|nr:winged helix-turn-helix transcriptional regulator [Bacteroidales bacterium]
MKAVLKSLLRYAAHLGGCGLFLYLFVKNALLRPACESPNTEVLIGLSLVALVYVNAYIFHPLLYRKNQTLLYIIATLLSVSAALAVELFLAYPQLLVSLGETVGMSKARNILLWTLPFVLSRDMGLVSFSFLICEFLATRRYGETVKKLVLDEKNLLLANDEEGNPALVAIGNIRFYVQERNYGKIFCGEGKPLFYYGSLKQFLLLDDGAQFVQVSRNTLVATAHILSYKNGSLLLENEKDPFPVSPTFMEEVRQKLSDIKPNMETGAPASGIKQKGKDNHLEKKRKSILNCIAKEPGVSSVSLSAITGFSHSTVNRILGQLKKEGLIEYRGSKKKGGYFVVERGEKETIDKR